MDYEGGGQALRHNVELFKQSVAADPVDLASRRVWVVVV
jgi:hypothetical protein